MCADASVCFSRCPGAEAPEPHGPRQDGGAQRRGGRALGAAGALGAEAARGLSALVGASDLKGEAVDRRVFEEGMGKGAGIGSNRHVFFPVLFEGYEL